jgi:hypothetical protein
MLLILAIEDALIRRLKSHILGNFPLGQTEARDELPITPFSWRRFIQVAVWSPLLTALSSTATPTETRKDYSAYA